VYRNGTVEVLSGCQDMGMGFRTLIGDIVRTQLGLPREAMSVKVGRGDYPPGPASGGSTTSVTVAPKSFVAADLARDGVLKLVANEWGLANADGLKLDKGLITGEGKSIEWKKACQLMTDDHLSFSTDQNGSYQKKQTQSQAVQFVEAMVDTETGVVKIKRVVALQNVGLPVNRNTIENQVAGAVIQGISYALFEDRILDRDTGAMVNTDLNMYKIAGPIDVPEIKTVIWREDWDVGVNCVGEPPAVPILGAVGTAVANAVGVQIASMPLTPDKILAALAGKESVA
jgi:xanthine dehydrogenase YagR molybdenum-binding subunit